MKKEILIVTGILIFIAILIFNCQRYLDHVTENMSNQLKGIRNQTISFSKNDLDQIKDAIDQIDILKSEWEIYEKKLSLYIENEELEKIDTCLIRMKSYLESNQYQEAIPEIDECIFWFQHIDFSSPFHGSCLFLTNILVE